MRSRILVAIWAGVTLAGASVGTGCDRSGSEPTARAESPNRPGATAAPEQTNSSSESDDRYATSASPEAVPVGASQSVTLRLEAGPGLKVNRRFPTWQLELDPPPSMQFERRSFGRDRFELSRGAAEVAATVRAKQAGTETIPATATLSVCNDSKCHVLREEQIEFTMEATETDASAQPTEGDRR